MFFCGQYIFHKFWQQTFFSAHILNIFFFWLLWRQTIFFIFFLGPLPPRYDIKWSLTPSDTAHSMRNTSGHGTFYTWHQQTRRTLYMTPADTAYSIRDTSRHVTLYTWHQRTRHILYVTPADTSHSIHDTSGHGIFYTWHQQIRHTLYMAPECNAGPYQPWSWLDNFLAGLTVSRNRPECNAHRNPAPLSLRWIDCPYVIRTGGDPYIL